MLIGNPLKKSKFVIPGQGEFGERHPGWGQKNR